MKREPDNIKAHQRALGFKRAKRLALCAHCGLHISPGMKRPLGQRPVKGINYVIQNFKPQMAHANIVNIRKGQRHPYINLRLILMDGVSLMVYVTAWPLNIL